jgi:hypothetical protein
MPDDINNNIRDQCHWCTKKNDSEHKLMRCAGCKCVLYIWLILLTPIWPRHRRVSYCSRDCQKKAWKTHKNSCAQGFEESLKDQPEVQKMNSRLSKWIDLWRNSLHSWSVHLMSANLSVYWENTRRSKMAMNLGAHPPDRLSKYWSVRKSMFSITTFWEWFKSMTASSSNWKQDLDVLTRPQSTFVL